MKKINLFLVIMIGAVSAFGQYGTFNAVRFVNVTDSTVIRNNPINGTIYYNTQSNKFRVYENGAWHDLGSGSGGGSGTVTSVTSANGDATVATTTTTPVITIVSAPKLTTARTIGTVTGDATSAGSSFDGSANNTNALTVTKINGTSLAGLATGVLKNTTGTGVPSIASGSDILTGLDTQTANTVLSGPTSGSAATPTFRSLINTDVATAFNISRTVTGATSTLQSDNLHTVYLGGSSPYNVTVDIMTDETQITFINTGSATVTLVPGTVSSITGTTTIAAGSTAVLVYESTTVPIVLSGSEGGTVTSVGFTGGLISVANPTTTPAFTVAGTSGGIPYFNSSSTWASSAVLASNDLMIGGGAGAAPSTTTTGTGVLTALGINVGSAGAFTTFNGALGTPSSGTLTNATGLPVTGLTGTWANLNSTLTGTAPFWLTTGTTTLTGASNISGTSSNTLKGTFDGLGTTQTNGAGLWLANTTAAAAGAQQRSPGLVLEGQGWKTNATAASQSVKFIMDVLPIEGGASPTSSLIFGNSINGGAYSNMITISSSGSLTFNQSAGVLNTNNIASNGSSLALNLNYGVNGINTGLRLQGNANSTISSGTTGALSILSGNNFAPTSGTANFYGIQLNHVINQTGTASGEYNDIENIPTVTSVLGIHRALKSPTGGILLNGVTSPSQITANQNDYTYTGLNQSFIQRLNSDASRDITGISAGASGEMKQLFNVGSFNIVLKNEDAGSTAANRFSIGSDFTMVPGGGALIWYDGTSSRWRIMSKN